MNDKEVAHLRFDLNGIIEDEEIDIPGFARIQVDVDDDDILHIHVLLKEVT